jgi:hypothetical protein
LRLGVTGGALAVLLVLVTLALDLLGGRALDGQQIVGRAAAAMLPPPGGFLYSRERLTLSVPGYTPPASYSIPAQSQTASGSALCSTDQGGRFGSSLQ